MQTYGVDRNTGGRPASLLRTLVKQIMHVWCAVVVCLSLSPSEAKAQTCIPPAVGVPFAAGPPKWWDNTPPGSAAIFDRIDDPRWKGAGSITHGSSATEQVSFRALHHTEGGAQSLYLSWWVKVAPT